MTDRCLIIGAGPAGLTGALELSRLGIPAALFEADVRVGGIAQTAVYNGYRFDIGGHRFFTKVDMVQEIWEDLLGEEFLERGRLSRIFYNDRFFDYPLKPVNALVGLGPVEAMRIGLSYLKAQAFPSSEERTFEQWVSNRFGRRLYEIFFKTYTEKVWGIPCSQIGADWAAQRIKNLDLMKAVRTALLGMRPRSKGEVITTLIDRFHYPRLGPGMMWERCQQRLEAVGIPTHLRTRVTAIHHEGGRVTGLTVQDAQGQSRREEAAHVLSSMPMRELIRAMDPPAPEPVQAAAERLRYRDYLTVVLIVDRADVFPDNWIYIHSPEVILGRIQNYKNWSPEMVPDPSKTALGLEYFVQEGDEIWSAADPDLVALGTKECARLGLIRESEVLDGCVVRMPKAYPVYDQDYQGALATIRSWLEGLPNLQLIGRNGQHRYNNQDHSMVTAIYAARNIAGASYDVWSVNVEEEYHEAGEGAGGRDRTPAGGGDRAVPRPLTGEDELAGLVRQAFARYDPAALGGAVAVVLASGFFLATAVALLRQDHPAGAYLSLLGSYFLGFDPTWAGAFLGTLEAGVGGWAFGYLLAHAVNGLVGWHESSYRRRAEMARLLQP